MEGETYILVADEFIEQCLTCDVQNKLLQNRFARVPEYCR